MTEPTRIPDMTMAGIPAYITRTQVIEIIESLGINSKSVRRLEFEIDSVTVEVFAKKLDGKIYRSGYNEVATHRLSIPVVDAEP